jgi:predicted transcriptional regulator
MGHLCHKFHVIKQNSLQQLTNKIIGTQCVLTHNPPCVLVIHNEISNPSFHIRYSVGLLATYKIKYSTFPI